MQRKCLLGVALFTALAPLATQAAEEHLATVYFIPPRVETYMPVTTKTVEGIAFEEWDLSSSGEVARLLSILEGAGSAEFDSVRVRVKVVTQTVTLFVDASGAVSPGGTSGRKIDLNAFATFRESLRTDQILSRHGK